MNNDEMRQQREDEIWNAAAPWVEEFTEHVDSIMQTDADMTVCVVAAETRPSTRQDPAGAIWMSGTAEWTGADLVAQMLIPVMRGIRADTGMSFEEMLHRAAHMLQMREYDELMRRCAEWGC